VAKRVFQNNNWTPTATADASTLTNATFMGVKGGSTSQYLDFLEFMIQGMGGASTPTALTFARASTLATNPTALAAPASDGVMNPFTVALAAPPVTFTAAGTPGQRSNLTTDAKLPLGINAFGGILRWNAAPGQQFSSYGNAVTAPAGESYLSSENYGTAGLIQASIIYEPQ
jgi:hypothetical protein